MEEIRVNEVSPSSCVPFSWKLGKSYARGSNIGLLNTLGLQTTLLT